VRSSLAPRQGRRGQGGHCRQVRTPAHGNLMIFLSLFVWLLRKLEKMEERIRKISWVFFFFFFSPIPSFHAIHTPFFFIFFSPFFFFFSPVAAERKAADLVGRPVGQRGRKKREERKKRKRNDRLAACMAGWEKQKRGKKKRKKRWETGVGQRTEEKFFFLIII
jgi:hypothetical protein